MSCILCDSKLAQCSYNTGAQTWHLLGRNFKTGVSQYFDIVLVLLQGIQVLQGHLVMKLYQNTIVHFFINTVFISNFACCFVWV
jgi:hypothetical protein